jgi:hypothetical protein
MLNSHGDLGRIDRSGTVRGRLTLVRLLLPLGWLLATIGYYGPWVAHRTAALTLCGVDMGEFVKFLPGVVDGSLTVVRQFFYLPPLAVVAGVALLTGSRRLRFSWPVRLLALVLAVPVSLQLLPPAWSPLSLMTAEFRLQTITLGICWLLLAGFWLLGRLPPWLAGSLGALLALAADMLSAWQYLVVKPAIDAVYKRPPAIGWGLFLCLLGLAVMLVACVILVLRAQMRSERHWAGV